MFSWPPMPDTLDGLHALLAAGSGLPGTDYAPQRVPLTALTNAPLAVIVDMPDADDAAAGHFIAGAAGRLYDAMLSSIGLSRAQVMLIPLAVTRPASGRIDPDDLPDYVIDDDE